MQPSRAGAAEVVGGEMAILQHGAHGSIEHEDTGGKGVVESLAAGLGHEKVSLFIVARREK